MKMYQVTITRAKNSTSLGSEAAIRSFDAYGYLEQEGWKIVPTKGFKTQKYELYYKDEFYNRFEDKKWAIEMYLEFVGGKLIEKEKETKKLARSKDLAKIDREELCYV